MISIGFLAKQYRMLPSEVLARATTYDLMIADVWSTWQEYKSKPTDTSNYKTEDLETLIKKAKQ
jgi:hypothetical protein